MNFNMLGDKSFVKEGFLLVLLSFFNMGGCQGIFECWNDSVGKEELKIHRRKVDIERNKLKRGTSILSNCGRTRSVAEVEDIADGREGTMIFK